MGNLFQYIQEFVLTEVSVFNYLFLLQLAQYMRWVDALLWVSSLFTGHYFCPHIYEAFIQCLAATGLFETVLNFSFKFGLIWNLQVFLMDSYVVVHLYKFVGWITGYDIIRLELNVSIDEAGCYIYEIEFYNFQILLVPIRVKYLNYLNSLNPLNSLNYCCYCY